MRPLLLGHRGARRRSPENTIAAFRRALADGCDGFEMDLRRTADAHCVLCHDKRLYRREVENSTYAELLEAHRRRRPDCSEDECPTLLERVLQNFPNAYMDLEIKVPGLEQNVAAALRAHPPAGAYIVSSFLPEVLLRYRQLEPGTPLGLIAQTSRRLSLWPTLPIESVFVYRTLLTARLMDEWHGAGKRVFVWTVNDRRDMQRFAQWGVDGIISDDAELLVRTLHPDRCGTAEARGR